MAEQSSWLDYFSPINLNQSTNKSDSNFEDDELLAQAKMTWNIGQNEKQYISEHGLTFEVPIPTLINRYFLIHEPRNIAQDHLKMPLLIFYHGFNSSAWFVALVRTKWIEHANTKRFSLVFGQSQGKQYRKGPKFNQHGHLQFGDDLSWEIQEPKVDFIYFDSILDTMKQRYKDKLDLSRIYYVGYSNGGLFSCNIAIHYGGQVIAAICNHCGGYGGLGYNDEELLDPNMIKKPLPIYLLTGTLDNYLSSCQKAKTKFETVGCHVKMDILKDRKHQYYVDKEDDIYNFLFSHQIDNLESIH